MITSSEVREKTTKKIFSRSLGTKVVYDNSLQKSALQVKQTILNSLEKIPIQGIHIETLSDEQIKKISVVDILTHENDPNKSVTNGVDDMKMGTGNFSEQCGYCSLIDCQGHCGKITFNNFSKSGEPIKIYNPATIDILVRVLQSVCSNCSRMFLTEEQIRAKDYNSKPKSQRLTAIANDSKGKICNHPKTKLSDEEIKFGCKPTANCSSVKRIYLNAKDAQKEGTIIYSIEGKDKHISKIRLSPSEAYNILKCIPDKDLRILGFTGSRPDNMIISSLIVPPNVARPPVFDGTRITSNPWTSYYSRIIQHLKSNGEEGVFGLLTELMLKNSKSGGNYGTNKSFTPLIMRLTGREGLLRNNVQGKRVDYTARSVANPGPLLKFGTAGVPQIWSKSLTKRVRVTDLNYERILSLISAKKILSLVSHNDNVNYLKSFVNNPSNVKVNIGDIVEIEMQSGDYAVVGRQPTLHATSIMGFVVKLISDFTIRIHMSITTPTNADFDGDEMGINMPRSFESISEVMYLMNAIYNLLSPEDAMNSMGLVMNGVLGSFLISDESVVLNKNFFIQVENLIRKKDNIYLSSLPARLAKYRVPRYSGKALLSLLFPDNFLYNKKGLLIIEGVVIFGKMKKGIVGVSQRSLVQELIKNCGLSSAVHFLTYGPQIIDRWLLEYGFSIGLKDVIIFDEEGNDIVDKIKQKELKEAFDKVYSLLPVISKKKNGAIAKLESEYIEARIFETINFSQNIAKKLAKEAFSGEGNKRMNSLGVMSSEDGSGAKGTIGNIGQIVGSVGQMTYGGARLKASITNGTRLLPTFFPNDPDPTTHGFIVNSFVRGLTPPELFFLQAGGREGLINTSITTSQTGYTQRRLIKAMESTSINYDGSVRNNIGKNMLISGFYNCGYDPAHNILVKDPDENSYFSFVDIGDLTAQLNAEKGWLLEDHYNKIKNRSFDEDFIKESDEFEEVAIEKTYPDKYPEPWQILTKYEKCRLIGSRAEQIDNNAPPLISGSLSDDPLVLAKAEFEKKLIPLNILRTYPNGRKEIVNNRNTTIFDI